MKENIFQDIEIQKEKLIEMADFIFDNPECNGEEKRLWKCLQIIWKKMDFL